MTPEKLKKVEEIYHDVLDIPSPERCRFLQNSCGEDFELRSEVESLLSFENITDNLIDSTPESLINEVFAEKPKIELIGSQINQYKLLSLLGEGGMGAVYLAYDTKLERKVAIKFLSDKFPKEGNGLSRFFLEAKSSSALNHPNIITIHEIGEVNNKPFIATEFIDGITLKDFLTNNNHKLSDILDIALQIASALGSAHKAGIIHRDIKPENVMIRRDGIVKVLDFGLAKLSQPDNQFETVSKMNSRFSTVHGLILGTPQFMSPEQARGKKVDIRTDIWSFGVLLYQMLSGKLPFQGETTSDVIASILKSEPLPLSQFVSADLENIVFKALEKNSNERYQSIDEFYDEIKLIRRELEFENKTETLNFRVSNSIKSDKNTNLKINQLTDGHSGFYSSKISLYMGQTVSKAREFPVFASFVLVAFISVIAGFGIGISKLNSTPVNQINTFQQMKLSKLTFDGTATNIVAVSPDGKYIVYALRKENKQKLMMRQVATSSIVQLLPAADVSYLGLVFSPDGNYVYYTVSENNSSNLYEIPALGGNPRKLINNVDGKISFSPNGNQLAFIRSGTSLIITDLKTRSEQILGNSNNNETFVLAEWKPDGKSILTSVYSSLDTKFYLTEVSAVDGSKKQISSQWLSIHGLAWLPDESGVIVLGRDTETKFSQIWQVPYPEGKPERITNDLSTYVGLSLTADGKSAVSLKQENLYNIWVSSIKNTAGLRKITIEEGRDEGLSGLSWTTDGKIVYTVRTKDSFDIWSINSDGNGNRQLTFEQGTNFDPAVSPDGKYIVFTSNRTGKSILWKMDIDGGNQTVLAESENSNDDANFTPDGKYIIYRKTDSNRIATIWKINVVDKLPIQLTETDSGRPAVSPDGKFFACQYGSGESAKVAVVSIDGGKPDKIYDFPLVLKSKVFRWSADGNSLIYIDKQDRTNNLWSQPLSNLPPKQLTFFESGQIERFDLTSDGQNIAFSRGIESSDVVLFDSIK